MDPGGAGGQEASVDCKYFSHFVNPSTNCLWILEGPVVKRLQLTVSTSLTLSVDPGGASGQEASVDCKYFSHFVNPSTDCLWILEGLVGKRLQLTVSTSLTL